MLQGSLRAAQVALPPHTARRDSWPQVFPLARPLQVQPQLCALTLHDGRVALPQPSSSLQAVLGHNSSIFHGAQAARLPVVRRRGRLSLQARAGHDARQQLPVPDLQALHPAGLGAAAPGGGGTARGPDWPERPEAAACKEERQRAAAPAVLSGCVARRRGCRRQDWKWPCTTLLCTFNSVCALLHWHATWHANDLQTRCSSLDQPQAPANFERNPLACRIQPQLHRLRYGLCSSSSRLRLTYTAVADTQMRSQFEELLSTMSSWSLLELYVIGTPG